MKSSGRSERTNSRNLIGEDIDNASRFTDIRSRGEPTEATSSWRPIQPRLSVLSPGIADIDGAGDGGEAGAELAFDPRPAAHAGLRLDLKARAQTERI